MLLASPKAKQKLVDNKITHILSIHDAAVPGDGVRLVQTNYHLVYEYDINRNMCTSVSSAQIVRQQICELLL